MNAALPYEACGIRTSWLHWNFASYDVRVRRFLSPQVLASPQFRSLQLRVCELHGGRQTARQCNALAPKRPRSLPPSQARVGFASGGVIVAEIERGRQAGIADLLSLPRLLTHAIMPDTLIVFAINRIRLLIWQHLSCLPNFAYPNRPYGI